MHESLTGDFADEFSVSLNDSAIETMAAICMKYRHSYHAGNFADTLKHLVLIELLNALARKPAPFFCLETHAGRGGYPIDSHEMRTAAEFQEGFAPLLKARADLPPALTRYVGLVLRLGSDPLSGRLQRYPGSPQLVATLLRPGDRAVLSELEPAEARALARLLHEHSNVHIRNEDGYTTLRALLPPRERRGLVFIDPAYERQEAEFDAVMAALKEGVARWASGIYAVWYPIKRRHPVARFHAQLVASGWRSILCAELNLFPEDSRVALNGCGMIVINPPWKLDHTLREALPALHLALGGRSGTGTRCDWLVPE